MRVIVHTGKGGVGKTSVSAATALRCAEMGLKTIVISTDTAHSLGDSLEKSIGPEPIQIHPNLWAQEVDARYSMDKYWGRIQKYLTSLLSKQGVEDIVAEENNAVFTGFRRFQLGVVAAVDDEFAPVAEQAEIGGVLRFELRDEFGGIGCLGRQRGCQQERQSRQFPHYFCSPKQ